MEKQCQWFGTSAGGGAHASSGTFEPTEAERALAERLLPAHLARFPASPHARGGVDGLSAKLAHLRRNLCVTICQRLWPVRMLAPAAQLCEAVVKDVERTFGGASQAAEDYTLLAASTPLRKCLSDFGVECDEVANRFERHCKRMCEQRVARR